MSTFVGVSVCVSEDVSGTTGAILTNFSVHVACGHGSVLLRQGEEIPVEGAMLTGCAGHSKALAIFAAAAAAVFAAKGIIQYARQAQIGIRKILSAGDAAYRSGRG